ncbi:caffeoyl-CoA O-methyltransferase [Jatrophihabitans endophyticus]|uniref:Caffeoyl-CoA O-methyltransferase n=1 Tax=Jatrophihabitans endophyticus TaxID=1206085 RepID=A0A1M5U3E0_9ACTN|nr:class I SAM-dependent methyltransferase [Jatrophihabitans endophyticus]SHH57479.1 caffeoyl-CoA O-methyltransferase [Jatrophihabitans endophyticus]
MTAARPAAPPVPRPVTPAGIVAERLAALAARAAALPGSDPGLVAELRGIAELAGGIEPYTRQCTTPESPDLAELARRTRSHDWSAAGGGLEQEMLSGHVEGRFLAVLVRATRARRVLDIGMFTGYSALAMAEALAYSAAGGRVVACERDAAVADLARAAFATAAAGELVDIRVGPAATTLDDLAAAGETFDLVFVDADKAGYRDYVDTVLRTGLLAEHGLLCIDNTLLQGQPWTGDGGPNGGHENGGHENGGHENGVAVAAFNDWLAADPRVDQVVVPLRDGITLACRTARR